MGTSRLFATGCAIAMVLTACTASDEDTDRPDEVEDGDVAPDEEDEEVALELAQLDEAGLSSEVGSVSLNAVAAGEPGWLVPGSVREPNGRPRAILATSDDGEGFDAAELPAPQANDHVGSAAGWIGDVGVVVGTAGPLGSAELVTWTGSGGDWELTDLDEVVRGSSLSVADAVPVGDVLIAVGSVRDDDGRWSPAVWTIDAEGQVVGSAAEFDDLEGDLDTVAVDGDTVLAAGRIGDPSRTTPMEVYRSDDGGETWSSTDAQGLDAARSGDLARTDDGWQLAGTRAGSGAGQVALWNSSDGTDWEPEDTDAYNFTSELSATYEIDGRRIGIGDWLYEPVDGRWETRRWPGTGDRGSFGDSALHDGRLVAVGSPSGVPRGLYTTTDGAQWTSIVIADDLLESTTGRSATSIQASASDGETLVLSGSRTDVSAGGATFRSLLTVAPGFEPASNVAAGLPGVVNDVLHDEERGWIAGGTLRDGAQPWAGAHVLRSDDGRSWDRWHLLRDEPNDRVNSIHAIDGSVVVVGMTWVDGAPTPLLWDVDDEVETIEPEGLGDWAPLRGCDGGDRLAVSLFDGVDGAAFGLSEDAGRTFEVYEGEPFDGSTGLRCAIDDDGDVLIVVYGRGEPELHRLDPASGEFEQLDLDLPVGSTVADIAWDADLGWMISGSERISDEERRGVVLVGTDPAELQVVRLASDDAEVYADTAVVVGSQLQVLGRVEGDLRRWGADVSELIG